MINIQGLIKDSNQVSQKSIMGVDFYCVDSERINKQNQFLLSGYNFDEGFYRGYFSFVDPVTQKNMDGTPEMYGRLRLVKYLTSEIKNTLTEDKKTILDLGCGNLNVARSIPQSLDHEIRMINSDISGPWSSEVRSSLELGTESLLEEERELDFLNIQYDFNNSKWPFESGIADFVTTCMVLHHVKPELKLDLMRDLFITLKPGGKLIVVDVFKKDDSGYKFTEAGERGPGGSEGHMVTITDFIRLASEAGFEVDEIAKRLLSEGRNYQNESELKAAVGSVSSTMAINKAAWFLVLSKPLK